MSAQLDWPREWVRERADHPVWFHAGSNLCLDFHGDPTSAGLSVFSDGNHHMALAETLRQFFVHHPEVGDIFYATTPPGVLVEALAAGGFSLGNLFLPARPHLFIGPAPILERLTVNGLVAAHEPFMRSRGNVLLVAAGNPKAIGSSRDLARADVRVFLSNPRTESASYQIYAETLAHQARAHDVVFDFLESRSERVVYGERIHHREAPQAIYDGRADVAVLYFHLALRYTRIFPGCFEMVSLDGGANTEPVASNANVVTIYHLGVVGQGGKWGAPLRAFLQTERTTEIYRHHGLERPSP